MKERERKRELKRVSGPLRVLHPEGLERGRSQGGLDILHAPRPRTGYYEYAVVIAERGRAPISLPHTDAQRVICAALRETRYAHESAGYLAQVKSIVAIRVIKERERYTRKREREASLPRDSLLR